MTCAEAPPTERTSRPASTRIIVEIALVEKEDKVKGQYWTAMLFEFAEWVRQRHEAKLRAEGRLL